MEERKARVKELLRKKLESNLPEEEQLDECRKVIAQLGRIADFKEVLAILEELTAYNRPYRDILLFAVFETSRQSVSELVGIAKGMPDEDKVTGIVGISEKMRLEELSYAELGKIHELANDPRGAQAFAVVLDLHSKIPPDAAAKKKFLGELADIARSLPEDRSAGFLVALAEAVRHDTPAAAWGMLSGAEDPALSPEEASAKTLSLMLERDPSAAMSSLLRGRPTSTDELESSLTYWVARDPAAAAEWYRVSSEMLIGAQAERLAKIMQGVAEAKAEGK
jgi:hypothetical protein